MTENMDMQENQISQESGPRYKILVLQFNPGAKPELRMATLMYGVPVGKEPEIGDYRHFLVTKLETPSTKEIPGTLERELAADEGFDPEEFFKDKPEQFGGIIITGSPFAAYPRATPEGVPYLTRWKKETISYIRAAVDHHVPILGICFGAQLLAEALGGEAERMKTKEGREVLEWGWNVIHRTSGSSGDLAMRGLPGSFIAAQNRRDCISRLPPGAVLIAENEYGIQGFRVDDEKGQPIAWGFQFHPERPLEAIDKVLSNDGQVKKLQEAGVDVTRVRDLRERYLRQDPPVTIIFSNFLDFVRSRI